jgi:hypothetical protein
MGDDLVERRCERERGVLAVIVHDDDEVDDLLLHDVAPCLLDRHLGIVGRHNHNDLFLQ